MVKTIADPLAQERAMKLAIVYLTRLDNVRVMQWSHGGGHTPDLVVALRENEVHTGHYFGVVPRPLPTGITFDSLPRSLGRIDSQLDHPLYREGDFPVCLFLFSMEDDQGYWRWMQKPIETPPGLTFAQEKAWTPLNNTTLNSLLLSVKQWYEERGKQGIQK
jgi:hypothetical protein